MFRRQAPGKPPERPVPPGPFLPREYFRPGVSPGHLGLPPRHETAVVNHPLPANRGRSASPRQRLPGRRCRGGADLDCSAARLELTEERLKVGAVEAVLVEVLGRPVGSGDDDRAPLPQLIEELHHDERVRHVRHLWAHGQSMT